MDDDFLGGFDAFEDYGDEGDKKVEEKKVEPTPPPKVEPAKPKKAPKPIPADYIYKAAEVKKVAVED